MILRKHVNQAQRRSVGIVLLALFAILGVGITVSPAAAYADVVKCSPNVHDPSTTIDGGIYFGAIVRCTPSKPDEAYFKLTLFKVDDFGGKYEWEKLNFNNPSYDETDGYVLQGYHDCGEYAETRYDGYYTELEAILYHHGDIQHKVTYTDPPKRLFC